MSAEDKPTRKGPGRPPLPPGVKPSEGNAHIKFRCEPELAAFILAHGGGPWVRSLVERERSRQ